MKRTFNRAAALAVSLAFAGQAIAQSVNTFEISPAAGGGQTFIRSAPLWIDNRVLAANVSETHTVPTNAKKVLFSFDCNFYARPTSSAAVPSSDVTDGTGSELNPVSWELSGITQITVIAAATCKGSLSFYR